MNFHEIMIAICDTFELSHDQMVALRQRVQAAYNCQRRGAGLTMKSADSIAAGVLRQMLEDVPYETVITQTYAQLVKNAWGD